MQLQLHLAPLEQDCTASTGYPQHVNYITGAPETISALRPRGIHDFNRYPWALPGTRATIFNPPETRTSFGPHAIDACYIGPAPHHYCCYNFFLPSTEVIRTSGQATLYPQHFTVPK